MNLIKQSSDDDVSFIKDIHGKWWYVINGRTNTKSFRSFDDALNDFDMYNRNPGGWSQYRDGDMQFKGGKWIKYDISKLPPKKVNKNTKYKTSKGQEYTQEDIDYYQARKIAQKKLRLVYVVTYLDTKGRMDETYTYALSFGFSAAFIGRAGYGFISDGKKDYDDIVYRRDVSKDTITTNTGVCFDKTYKPGMSHYPMSSQFSEHAEVKNPKSFWESNSKLKKLQHGIHIDWKTGNTLFDNQNKLATQINKITGVKLKNALLKYFKYMGYEVKDIKVYANTFKFHKNN